MRFNKLFYMLLALVVFAACEKDKPTPDMPAAESKVLIASANEQVLAEMNTMSSNEAFDALTVLEELGTPLSFASFEGLKKAQQWYRPFELSEKPEVKKIGSEPFKMADYAGTYTYNFSSKDFDFVAGTPSDKIVMHFPTAGSQTNNAVYTVRKVEDQLVLAMGINFYTLARIEYELSINQVKKLDVIQQQNFDMVNGVIALSYQIEAGTHKAEMRLNINKTNYEAEVKLSKSGVSFFHVVQKSAIDSEGEMAGEMSYYVQMASTMVEGTINLDKMDAADTDEELNKAVSLTLYSYPAKAKMGVMKFRTVGEEESAYFVLNDGSEVNADDYFEDAMELMFALFGFEPDLDPNLDL